MNHHPVPGISDASLAALHAIPGRLLRTSAGTAWTSVLVARHRSDPARSAVETLPTPDLTLGVALSGQHRLQVLEDGSWRSCFYAPGALGLTPPGETDRLRWNSPDVFEVAHVFLSRHVLAETAEELRQAGTSSAMPHLSALVLHDPLVLSTVEALLSAAEAGAPVLYADQAARWLATHLLVRHGGHVRPRNGGRGYASVDTRLARVTSLLRERFAEPLSLDLLASEAGISKFHFARLFRQRTGQPPHAFLTAVRMGHARRLLAQDDLPVSAVSVRCGFASHAQFATAFRRAHGMSPGAFRRNQVQGGS